MEQEEEKERVTVEQEEEKQGVTREHEDEIEIKKKNLMDKYQLTDCMLETKCSDEHLLKIKQFIPWRDVGEFLPEIESHHIDDTAMEGVNESDRRRVFINKWVDLNGDDATYGVMIIALLKGKKRNDATKVCRMLAGQ